MGFRIGSSPDFIDKVWPVRTSKKPPAAELPPETPEKERARLKTFAAARLRA